MEAAATMEEERAAATLLARTQQAHHHAQQQQQQQQQQHAQQRPQQQQLHPQQPSHLHHPAHAAAALWGGYDDAAAALLHRQEEEMALFEAIALSRSETERQIAAAVTLAAHAQLHRPLTGAETGAGYDYEYIEQQQQHAQQAQAHAQHEREIHMRRAATLQQQQQQKQQQQQHQQQQHHLLQQRQKQQQLQQQQQAAQERLKMELNRRNALDLRTGQQGHPSGGEDHPTAKKTGSSRSETPTNNSQMPGSATATAGHNGPSSQEAQTQGHEPNPKPRPLTNKRSSSPPKKRQLENDAPDAVDVISIDGSSDEDDSTRKRKKQDVVIQEGISPSKKKKKKIRPNESSPQQQQRKKSRTTLKGHGSTMKRSHNRRRSSSISSGSSASTSSDKHPSATGKNRGNRKSMDRNKEHPDTGKGTQSVEKRRMGAAPPSRKDNHRTTNNNKNDRAVPRPSEDSVVVEASNEYSMEEEKMGKIRSVDFSFHGSAAADVAKAAVTHSLEKVVNLPLAGPFVQGIITGNDRVFDSIDGEMALAQTKLTSKILLLATLHNKETETAKDKDATTAETPKLPVHGARLEGNEVRVHDPDRIVLSVDVIGLIAAELVADRRQSMKDAVQVAYVEMKKRHNTVVAVVNAKQTAPPEAQKRKRHDDNDDGEEEKRRSKETEEMRKAHCAEVDAVEREHEEFIKDMLKTHREELAGARKKLEDERNCHARVLNSYLAASRDSLRLLRKNPRYKRD
eukprot:scaffold239150_cov50-Attheya_sp.AAC.1